MLGTSGFPFQCHPCILLTSDRGALVWSTYLFAQASLPVSDACLGVSLLHAERPAALQSPRVGCSCLRPVEHMAGLLGFSAIPVPGFGLHFVGVLCMRWTLTLCQTP